MTDYEEDCEEEFEEDEDRIAERREREWADWEADGQIEEQMLENCR